MYESILFGATFSILLAAVFFDIKTMKIPNFLTLPAIGTGLILTALYNTHALFYTLLAVGFLYLLSYLPIMGGGDLKLLMAVTAMNGWSAGLLTVLFGSIAAVLVLFFRKPKAAYAETQCTIQNAMQGRLLSDTGSERFAFAPYLTIGFILSYTAIEVYQYVH